MQLGTLRVPYLRTTDAVGAAGGTAGERVRSTGRRPVRSLRWASETTKTDTTR